MGHIYVRVSDKHLGLNTGMLKLTHRRVLYDFSYCDNSLTKHVHHGLPAPLCWYQCLSVDGARRRFMNQQLGYRELNPF